MKAVVALFLAYALSGCASVSIESFSTFSVSADSNASAPVEGGIDFHGMPLMPGQIIVSDNNKAINLIVTLTDVDYHRFSHAGIISIEDGKPYVYQAVAELRLLFKGSPTDLTKGFIKRTPLMSFLKDVTVSAIYDPETVAMGQSMAEFAARSHAAKMQYDALFDASDRSKVYCSEFIVSAIESSGGAEIPLRARSRHPSIDIIYDWLSIEAKGHYFVTDLVANNHRAVLLSNKLSPSQIELYFLMREELHRRFSIDQKIGNIMSWTGFGVAFRPQIKAFIERGLNGEFREPGLGETDTEWVAALADEVLGKVWGH